MGKVFQFYLTGHMLQHIPTGPHAAFFTFSSSLTAATGDLAFRASVPFAETSFFASALTELNSRVDL